MKKINKGIALLLLLVLILPMFQVTTSQAAGTWKVTGKHFCVLNKIYPTNFDTNGVIYGYYKGKAALMDAVTGKLIKVTPYTYFNEIRPNVYNSNIDAIVTKKTNGTLLFGLIDKAGNTLIPANKYTELYYTNHGFRGIDAKKNTYFMTRTGKILYTYGENDILQEYGNFFVVYQPAYPEKQTANTPPESVEIKGIYDYSGNVITEIPDEWKTAANQFWLSYNTVIKKIQNEVITAVNKTIPADQKQITDEDVTITPLGNCYKVSAHDQYWLYDRTGTLIDTADEFLTIYGNDCVVLRKLIKNKDNFEYTVSSATLYNTKTYQKTENTDFTDNGDYYLHINAFGKYFISYNVLDSDYYDNVKLYDSNGKLMKECGRNLSHLGNCISLDHIYNQNLEILTFDGKFIPNGSEDGNNIEQGAILYKTLAKNKVQLSFLDDSLKVVAKTILYKNIDNIRIYQYKILNNNNGVYIKYGIGKTVTESIYDSNGKIINTYSDTKEDTNLFYKSNGTIIYTGRMNLAASVNLERAVITSLKNTGYGEATVTWNPIAGATGYQVNVSYDGTGTDPGYYVTNHYTTKGTSLQFRALRIGCNYHFSVRAYIQPETSFVGGRFSTSKSLIIK
jgi:Fibronectin type III domain.